MKANWTLAVALGGMATIGVFASAQAQQAQIPTLQVCNPTSVKGEATVKLASRADAAHAGVFTLKIGVGCTSAYPEGSMDLIVDMSDSFKGTITATQFDQVTTTGKHAPIAYMNGRCRGGNIVGCRFWLMVADNPQDKLGDVIGFLVFDGKGNRVAYGAGAVDAGDIVISPSAF
jgi:hypothetical protein